MTRLNGNNQPKAYLWLCTQQELVRDLVCVFVVAVARGFTPASWVSMSR